MKVEKLRCPQCGYVLELPAGDRCPICPRCGFFECSGWEVVR